MKWQQEFGCALLPLKPASAAAALQPDHVALYLMLPDNWKFKTHRWGPGMVATLQGIKPVAGFGTQNEWQQGLL